MITIFNSIFFPLIQQRIINRLIIVFFGMSLAACSALKLGYNQADRLTYWWLDTYLDFSEAQAPHVRRHISAFWAWHRKTQLSDGAHLLDLARQEVALDVTPGQLCQWAVEVSRRVDISLEQMGASWVEVGRTLSEAQLGHMAKKFEKVNEEFIKQFLQADQSKRQKAALKRVVERAESLYGPLQGQQKELLAGLVAASPFSPQNWLAERKQRQQDILQWLRALPRMSHEEALQSATALLKSYVHSPRPVYAAYHEALLQYHCTLAAQLHQTTTTGQRAQAAKRLKAWEDDLRALIKQAQGGGYLHGGVQSSP
jgi:hypothetical protein